MPNWKKVITSGSNAELNQITSSKMSIGHITASGGISSSGKIFAENTSCLALLWFNRTNSG